MGNEEKRALQAAALLEFEDAKAELALLRTKAEQLRKVHEKVQLLLARMRRDDAQAERVALGARIEINSQPALFSAAMDLGSILALDSELQAAIERLRAAEEAKRSLGFS